MGSILSRILTIVVGVAGIAVGGLFIFQSWKMIGELPAETAAEHAEGSGDGAEHAAADGHGGGHEAAPSAHGEPAGHGAPAAPAADAHGAPARDTASTGGETKGSISRTWVSMEQMFVNLSGPENEGHSLTFQIEVELFEEDKRGVLEARLATIKNAAIEVARDQSYDRLKSLSGKLYFKEALVTAMNETMHAPIIRDVHLSSIFLK